MAIDLHTHSTASDGTLAPAEVVRRAQARGLSGLALTDHETTAGLAEAAAEARRLGIDFVPGIEINTDAGEGEFHFLGYHIRPEDPGLQAALSRAVEHRWIRARAILARMRAEGIRVEEAAVASAANGAPVCRPHIALALVEAGYAESLPDAFERYLSRKSRFYVPRTGLTVGEAIAAIRDAGGVPVLSHPRDLPEEEVLALIPHGLRGVETDHPEHSASMAAFWHTVASRAGLVATGGSDYHGPASVHPDREIGEVRMPDAALTELRRAQTDLPSVR